MCRAAIAGITFVCLGFLSVQATAGEAIGSWFCKHGDLAYGTLGIARDYYIVVGAGRGSYKEVSELVAVVDGPLSSVGVLGGLLQVGERRTIIFATAAGPDLVCDEVL